MLLNSTHRNMLISPIRSIGGKVELYDGSTLLHTFTHSDALSEFSVSRAGAQRFFGFGVCQELELKLLDKDRYINMEENQILKVSFVANNSTISPTPKFYVSEISRDENTNALTIKAYDAIHQAHNHTAAELELEAPYTMLDVVSKITQLLGISFTFSVIDRVAFNVEYPEGANLDGTETLKEVLDAIAAATQTIYYMTNGNALAFKHLDLNGEPVLTINKSDYFTLKNNTNRTLAAIGSATELGDNVSISAEGVTGETQYIRDNPFWELREDIADLLANAIGYVGGLSINAFECEWRGNYLLEIGDKINIVTKDNDVITTYLLDDKYTYNGGLSAKTSWEYADNDGETASNPSTLGAALKQTYAKVDKANKTIEIVAGETAVIKANSEAISASVKKIDENVTGLTKEVSTKLSADEVSIYIQKAMESGTDKVVTSTGYTFNEDGLHVHKSNSEISTTISENGMAVSKNNTEVLVANNEGVKAEDLHATTFLIIGNTSRFEDYGAGRTGCFWIGK